jgi:hypothetical protein
MSIGLLTVVAPGRALAVEPGTPLPSPPPGTVANGVAYVGDTVFASFRPADLPGADGIVHRTPSDGSGSWSPVSAPGSATPLSVGPDRLVARGDTMLLPLTPDDPATPCAEYVLVTSSGERPLQSCGEPPVLGHGGLLLARRVVQQGSAQWIVERVSDGVAVQTTATRPTMAATVVWRVNSTSSSASLVWTDTATNKSAGRGLPGECVGGVLVDAIPPFALVHCGDSYVLVDGVGTLTPRLLPVGSWRLGNGFVHDEQPDPTAPGHRMVRVLEIARSPAMHTYGWSSQGGEGNSSGLAEPDDAGAHSLVMATEEGGLQRVDLTWVGSPPTPVQDTTPPVIDQVTGPPSSVPGVQPDGYPSTPLTFSWTGHDPDDTGSLVYDVRAYSERDGRQTGLYVPQMDREFATSVTVHEHDVDTHVCVQVRARDWVGNASVGVDSGWSAPQCTFVTSRPPTTWPSIDIATLGGLIDRLGPAVVTFTLGGLDDAAPVASSDIDYRFAGPGQPLGDWTSPAAWQLTTAPSVSQSVPSGGQVCFRGRARDRAGNLSAYSDPRCLTVPYDDRAFRIHGGAKRVPRAAALGGTVTKSWGRHGSGSMTMRHVTGQQVWIRFVGPRPAGACAGVSLGGRRARGGCFLEQTPGAVWQRFEFRPGTYGRLRIRSAYSIDAVAVIR